MASAQWPPAAKRTAAWSDWLLVAAIAVYLLANIPYLMAWPPVNGDEGREMNAFWVASGIDPSARNLDPVFQHDPLYKGGLQGFTTGISFRLGGLGLFQGRIVSLIWGGALLWSTYLAGRRIVGQAASVLAVLFLAVSQPFLVSSHIVRPDVMVATLVMLALWASLRGVETGGRIWHLLSGLLLGLSFDVHPNTLAFMPLVGLVYVYVHGRRFLVQRDAWIFVAGLGIAAAYYLGARVLPDPVHYLETFQYWVGVDKRPPLLATRGGSPIQAELGRWTSYFSHRYLELGVLGIGVVVAGIRSVRHRCPDLLIAGLAIAITVFTVLVSSKTEFYMILFFPLLTLLLGSALATIHEQLTGHRVLAAVAAVALALGGMGFEDNFRDMVEAASDLKERDYGTLTAQIEAYIPAGSRVIAPPIYWIGLSNPPYYLDFVDFYVWERVSRERRTSWSEFLAEINPSYVILDSKAKYEVTRTGQTRFMEDNAELLGSIRHVNYGRVEIWKMRQGGR
ncbi:MAG: glycosyltransferase family 39 protein [Chloroflexota bacterium]